MNRATRATVIAISMILAVSGSLGHGLWEILEGYSWWRTTLPGPLRRVLGRLWPCLLASGCILFVVGLVIAITGYLPGMSDPDQILSVDWTIRGIGYLSLLLACVAGFAVDMGKQEERVWV
jgi:hypothetical protein